MELDRARPRRSVRQLLHDEQGRIDIKSMSRDDAIAWMMEEVGATEGQALRTYKAIWQKGARNFEEIDQVAGPLRKKLAQKAYISFLAPNLVLRSSDGTVKYLWTLEDGEQIESVLIPDGDRLTLCISSQVGCAMACTFCLTGDLGLKRQLKPSEIANQPLQVGRQLPEGVRITNLVLMGMGEPLHNLDNLTRALDVCLDDEALNFSHRKITVSTVGLVPKMGELAARLPVNLAVSLNASSHEQRAQIMPITGRYSLDELLQACRDFPLPSGKMITFEYVMLRDFNDSLEDAERLVGLLEGIRAKVNLIPYNENPDRTLRRPTDEAVDAFQDYLVKRHLNATVRVSRGRDISAACGQLGKAAQQAVDEGWLQTARAIAGM
ncbi:MAG: 23S rRNA (adenine(2503)-C(2))-methyltransferase RlmN [Deltaproteobacteria bacterium]|nr:MAG: 23S rRNA (adenine(2503)-C(2))-methyltransferase RlmN [Deltaproteobacteria bacterium]